MFGTESSCKYHLHPPVSSENAHDSVRLNGCGCFPSEAAAEGKVSSFPPPSFLASMVAGGKVEKSGIYHFSTESQHSKLAGLSARLAFSHSLLPCAWRVFICQPRLLVCVLEILVFGSRLVCKRCACSCFR